eukprot:3846860-Prorocentrum_lima.AAC.1
MTSDPLLDHEQAYRISSAIYIEEANREPLIPHNAYARIMDPRETYGVLIRHGLLDPGNVPGYHQVSLGKAMVA